MRVVLVGNKSFPETDIIKGLAHRPPGGITNEVAKFDPTTLRVDQRRIQQFYAEQGFFSTQTPKIETSQMHLGVRVRFFVVEGPRTYIQSVETPGVPPGLVKEVDAALSGLGLKPGQPLIHAQYSDAKSKMLALLEDHGYAHALVTGSIKVNRDTRRAEVRLDLDPGPKVRFGTTFIDRSDTTVPEKSIRARVVWKKGEDYLPEKIEDTHRYLRELSFSSVRIDLERTGRPAITDTSIKTNDGKPREIKFGVGGLKSGSDLEARIRGDYVQNRFFHPLLILRTSGDIGRDFDSTQSFTYRLEGSLTRLDFIVPLFSASVTGRARYDDYEAFRALDTSGSLLFERPFFARKLRLSGGWQFHIVDINRRGGVPDSTMDKLSGIDNTTQRLAYFQQAVTVDLRDNQFSPRRGAFGELQFEEGGAYAGGELSYLRTQLDLRGYLPLGSRLVLAVRGLGGLLQEREDDAGEPLTRRFYAGGPSSHRGFQFRRLAPYVIQVDEETLLFKDRLPVGGKTLALMSGELRFALAQFDENFGLELATFFDAGDVTQTFDDFDPKLLHYATGAGIRLQTPLGPLRADFAWRLNRLGVTEPDGTLNPSPGDRFVFHLTFGEPF